MKEKLNRFVTERAVLLCLLGLPVSLVASATAQAQFGLNRPPVLDRIFADQVAAREAEYLYDVSTHFSDPEGGDLSFTVIGLPDGLQMDEDGLITGVPEELGIAEVEVTATDPEGSRTTDSYELSIEEAVLPALGGGPALQNNNSVISNVRLRPGSLVLGGSVQHRIYGSADQPAVMTTFVHGDARLFNVIIGNGSFVSAIPLNRSIRFASSAPIPYSTELTPALRTISPAEPTFSFSPVDLSDDVVVTLQNEVITPIRQAIEELGEFQAAGMTLSQESFNGVLSVDQGQLRYSLFPVSVSRTAFTASPGIELTEDGDLIITTETEREVLLQPQFENLSHLRQLAESSGLELTMDEQSVFTFSVPGAAAGSDFVARADPVSLPAGAGAAPGLGSRPHSESALNFPLFVQRFEDADGVLREQRLLPAAANWSELREMLLGLDEVIRARYGLDGILEVIYEGLMYRAVFDYEVTRSAAEPRDEVLLEATPDRNGDGSPDFLVTYTSGDQQALYLIP